MKVLLAPLIKFSIEGKLDIWTGSKETQGGDHFGNLDLGGGKWF